MRDADILKTLGSDHEIAAALGKPVTAEMVRKWRAPDRGIAWPWRLAVADLAKARRVKLPATLIFDHPSIGSIAAFLENDVLWPDERTPVLATVSQPVPSLATEHVADLSDAEIERLLLEKLDRL